MLEAGPALHSLSLPVPAFLGCPGPNPAEMLCTSLGQGQPSLIPVHSSMFLQSREMERKGLPLLRLFLPFSLPSFNFCDP